MTREQILHEAERCVCGQREQDYGSTEDSFGLIARLWSEYLSDELFSISLSPVDVSMMMALLKMARIKGDRNKADSFVDLAGYAAFGGEIATET